MSLGRPYGHTHGSVLGHMAKSVLTTG
ncbi:hypothetical protein F383_21900 [Gossypium arboreum]|uniref:Uncharacterized protein n=1 Tax=Gossypium arboreum TaxID=29729 RepID=A0A0B0NWY1_GOSAR|nr:hypothetical protein F383_21900 [Gossypium arboreum]